MTSYTYLLLVYELFHKKNYQEWIYIDRASLVAQVLPLIDIKITKM